MEFINRKEYKRLFNKKMNNPIFWDLHENVIVDSFVGNIFEENRFLNDIFFLSSYDILKYDASSSSIHFDHSFTIMLKSHVTHISDFETVTGIVTFPYDIEFDKLSENIFNIPENWSLFIINPILMKYDDEGSTGIFLTPRYAEDLFICECNNFIKSRTGFPLFLKPTDNPYIPKIIFDKPVLSLDNYIKEMKKTANRGLCKLLDFWAENDCVEVSSFEYSFDDYKDNLYYSTWEDINLKDIVSSIPFEIIHEETGKSLGKFKRFNLDKTFNLAYTDNGVLKLSDYQINYLIDGKFNFKLIK